jgi:phosphoribosylaminoimidazole-succinocarboxamide synthase
VIGKDLLAAQLPHTLDSADLNLPGTCSRGKVRDSWHREGRRLIVTSDRVSAFDVVLTTIPFKGQVLNQMAAFWFDATRDIVANHMVSLPDPNAMIVRDAEPLKVEMVVRGYLTGTTSTSVWTHYRNGVRDFCGNPLAEGMRKDERFPKPLLTPSTKAEIGEHDESVSAAEIVRRGHVDQATMDELCRVSLELFARGQEIAARQGIILVDTKYEFGLLDGKVILIDEIHTPDSSRFWYADTYEERYTKGEEQRRIDKDVLRTWLSARGFTGDGPVPPITEDVRIEAAWKYIEAFETITGNPFRAEVGPVAQRLARITDY